MILRIIWSNAPVISL